MFMTKIIRFYLNIRMGCSQSGKVNTLIFNIDYILKQKLLLKQMIDKVMRLQKNT